MAAPIKTPVSPKVKWGTIWAALAGIGAAAVGAGAAALDPHLFDTLGAFGPLIYTAIVTGAGSLAAWLTKDQLRYIGAQTLDDSERAVNTLAAVNAASFPAPVYGTFGEPAKEAPEVSETTIQS